MSTSLRKRRTSAPQDHPAQPVRRPAGRHSQSVTVATTGARRLVLAKGMRYRANATTIEVAYGAWRWTTRVLAALAIAALALGFVAGLVLGALAVRGTL